MQIFRYDIIHNLSVDPAVNEITCVVASEALDPYSKFEHSL